MKDHIKEELKRAKEAGQATSEKVYATVKSAVAAYLS